jgi:hypothetical protein
MRTLTRLGLAMGSVTLGILSLLALASYVSAVSSESGIPDTAAVPVTVDRPTASTYAPACATDLVITKTVTIRAMR